MSAQADELDHPRRADMILRLFHDVGVLDVGAVKQDKR
jgi:hypothetical protein